MEAPKSLIFGECKLCQAHGRPGVFAEKNSFERHMKFHTEDFVCKICKQNFISKQKLQEHKCSKRMRKICKHCGASVKNNSSLRLHLKRIHGIDMSLTSSGSEPSQGTLDRDVQMMFKSEDVENWNVPNIVEMRPPSAAPASCTQRCEKLDSSLASSTFEPTNIISPKKEITDHSFQFKDGMIDTHCGHWYFQCPQCMIWAKEYKYNDHINEHVKSGSVTPGELKKFYCDLFYKLTEMKFDAREGFGAMKILEAPKYPFEFPQYPQ